MDTSIDRGKKYPGPTRSNTAITRLMRIMLAPAWFVGGLLVSMSVWLAPPGKAVGGASSYSLITPGTGDSDN